MQVLGATSTPMQITPSVTARDAVTATRILASSVAAQNDASRARQSKKEAADAEKLQEQSNALFQLKNQPEDWRATARADAWKKVEHLKQILKQMKALAAGNPQSMAKALAQITRELAAAVKQYVQAGGSSEATGVQNDLAPANATENKNAQADTHGSAESGSAQEGGAPSSSPLSSNAQNAQTAAGLYEKIQNGLQGPSPTAAPQLNGDEDQNNFFSTVREFESGLRDILDATKRSLSSSGNSDHDVQESEKALTEIDRTMSAMTGSTGGIALLGSLVNFKA